MTQLRSNPSLLLKEDKTAIHTMLYDQLADEYKRRAVETLQAGGLQPTASLISDYAPGSELLELGVGGGAMITSMAEVGFHTSGIDISPKMIDNARSNHPDGTYYVGPYEDVLFPQSFDAIIGLAFIHLFDKDESSDMLTKIYNDLTDDGIVYLSTTVEEEYEYAFFNKDDYGEDVGRWRAKHTPDSFVGLLCGTGLTLKRFESTPGAYGKDRMYMIASK